MNDMGYSRSLSTIISHYELSLHLCLVPSKPQQVLVLSHRICWYMLFVIHFLHTMWGVCLGDTPTSRRCCGHPSNSRANPPGLWALLTIHSPAMFHSGHWLDRPVVLPCQTMVSLDGLHMSGKNDCTKSCAARIDFPAIMVDSW